MQQQKEINHVFQDVRQSTIHEDRIEIDFTLNELAYYLVIKREDNLFEPWGIFHKKEMVECPICDNSHHSLCETLDGQLEPIFHQLIEHPSLRLEWLYIPHVSQTE